ncbi:MAG: hypothetical protein ISR65_11805 [Bacteriovoracaceae bacterium]|nr:hypothetical protein [Bacteriovoracaceae bacterium]
MKNFQLFVFITIFFCIQARATTPDRIIITAKDSPTQTIAKLKQLTKKSKFVFTSDLELIISLTATKRPNHMSLQGSKKATTAGYIFSRVDEKNIVELSIDNRSGHICPSYQSLNFVFEFLANKVKIGAVVTMTNSPNTQKCD